MRLGGTRGQSIFEKRTPKNAATARSWRRRRYSFSRRPVALGLAEHARRSTAPDGLTECPDKASDDGEKIRERAGEGVVGVQRDMSDLESEERVARPQNCAPAAGRACRAEAAARLWKRGVFYSTGQDSNTAPRRGRATETAGRGAGRGWRFVLARPRRQ